MKKSDRNVYTEKSCGEIVGVVMDHIEGLKPTKRDRAELMLLFRRCCPDKKIAPATSEDVLWFNVTEKNGKKNLTNRPECGIR